MIATHTLCNESLTVEWGGMKKKDRMSEGDSMKSAFNAQLQPLRTLTTVTIKRRALKKKAAKNAEFAKSTTTTSG
jgi:hypothetical protein